MKLSGLKSLVVLVAAWCMALIGPVVHPASAEEQTIRADAREPPPPPGTSRLISIGPQALVREDDHGNLTMVDEPEPKRSKLNVAGIILGAMTAGVVVVFYGDLGPGIGPTNRTGGGSNSEGR
ncbi:MAG TPA: hypothetical protein VKU44_09850 [Terriglobia bacterium]|nr:hypothetical protein [Terriglobia bacterium]